ncbi:aldehyde dehydrogenase (NADP(+)) [Brevibacterium sanguinis]|uniref:aldehyde dehydrogenase (NADP(+)) n=1 Tax=Brevibacterium sanguinis TaxID=232444 RepID=UPI0031D91581
MTTDTTTSTDATASATSPTGSTASALSPDLEAIVAAAAAAAPAFAGTSPAGRADALSAVADALEAARETLVPIAMRETGLSEARLNGELTRTAVQLRMFATTLREGAYVDARIDPADDAFALGVRPDVRRVHIPVGPVLNFAASNFPFAFSVAGGDSAAALAAGCPLIVKAYSGHPELSDATAAVVDRAVTDAGMPAGVFALIHGQEAGTAVLEDERIKAGSFTGSIRAGRLLADIAAARSTPIPFFGELGSVNPVFVTEAALAEAGPDIAAGYVTSVSGSAGQLCTKPGFLFAPAGHGLDEAIATAADAVEEHRLLNPGIARGFAERRDTILAVPGVRVIAEGGLRIDDDGQGWARPTLVALSLADFRAHREALLDEAFGPRSIIVEVPAGTSYADLVPEFFAGNLTATLHLSTAETAGETQDRDRLGELVDAVSRQVGRVLFGGWPTGVAVTPAMQHGGPWPATTNDASTSVGSAAIQRFLRPVAFQNAPAAFLPAALQDANPLDLPQAVSPAGASTTWG